MCARSILIHPPERAVSKSPSNYYCSFICLFIGIALQIKISPLCEAINSELSIEDAVAQAIDKSHGGHVGPRHTVWELVPKGRFTRR